MGSKEEIAQARTRMEKAIEDLRKELATIRTGRASISILDSIQVDYYGVPTPTNQVAQMGTPDATLITVPGCVPPPLLRNSGTSNVPVIRRLMIEPSLIGASVVIVNACG